MTTTGLTEYQAQMRLAAATVGAKAAAATRKTTANITRDAKALAPVDTGNLRASIGSTITGDGRFGVLRAEIGPTASYARHVELGTSRMRAQPFLRPATDRHLPGWYAALSQINKSI